MRINFSSLWSKINNIVFWAWSDLYRVSIILGLYWWEWGRGKVSDWIRDWKYFRNVVRSFVSRVESYEAQSEK